MQTPSSSSASSVAGESPRLRRSRAATAEPPGPDSSSPAGSSMSTPSTPVGRRLTMTLPKVPKMPNFLTLNSPKKLQQQHNLHQQQEIKDKNEPSRFLGDGVSFKAKLIGILEVGEARGDRMCQEALADLKMAIRAAGEHKQRITINIAIDGLRLRDEKTMDCLYHHPVHKISFIAQDMTDSRAFGYIFGSPDTGHRFFGIKTDKAAGQVVVAMRDLFQVVFELKKKEIELAKQHIEQQQLKYTAGKSLENLSYSKNGASGTEASGSSSKSRSTREELRENGCIGTSTKSAQQTSEAEASGQFDVFTELDPLGTGKIRPYVDKKDFFQELKNPPKKVLKELAGEPSDPAPLFSATFENPSPSSIASTAKPSSSQVFPSTISSPPLTTTLPSSLAAHTADVLTLDPFADTDPFGETDPFVDEDLPTSANSFPPDDPFDTCFADFTMFGGRQSNKQGNAASVYHGPLRVSLPPEKGGANPDAGVTLLPPPPTSRRSSPSPGAKPKSPRLTKQVSAGAATTLVRLPSPKNTQSRAARRLAKQATLADARSGPMLRSPPSPRNLVDEERLSSSSVELTDIAPEPPPRPAASKPPPLPPKRQQQSGLSLKPPPRPPPSDQYDYINHHEDPDDPTSPPLPVPVRRPRSQGSEIPRPRQQTSVEFTQFSLPPPPVPAIVREEKRLKSTGAAANLTLHQLTKMNISELASSLNVSPGHLSKMTLQELASFLASVSTEGSPSSTTDNNKLDSDTPIKRQQYSALRESVDDESFKADFENNFTDFPTDFEGKSTEDVFQEAPFDKYAVFRELVEQEEEGGDVTQDLEEEASEAITEIAVEQQGHVSPMPEADRRAAVERSDSAMAEEGRRAGEEEYDEEEEEEDFGEEGTEADKYAALRDICSEPTQLDEESEKEDSVTEAAAEKMDDDFNLLTLSRQQSESPESPTQEIVNVRETQSIIESTILEEEIGSDTGSHDEDVEQTEIAPEKSSTEVLSEPIHKTIPTTKLSPNPTPVSTERIPPPSELALRDKNQENDEEREEGWAKFEESNFDSVESRSHNDDAVSPWSLEGKELAPGKPYKESPDSVNPRSRRKHGPRRESPWQEDDEDEDDEDWDGRGHRENGWRDGERGSRSARPRRRSPWGGRGPPRRTSPWEDDDEEGDVEEYDEVAYKSRPPPRATSGERRSRRPPSWEDEEPDYDEPRPARRVVGWGSQSQQERERRREYEEKRERSGSRGEYMERRRWDREDEEAGKPRRSLAKYPGNYATWGERGSRKTAQERRSRESAAMTRKQYNIHYMHYREQRPPVDYDYDDPENYDPRYKGKKGAPWPKRPSSASDVRKGPTRRGFQSPSSSHSHDADQLDDNFSVDRRFRTPSGDQVPTRGYIDDIQDFNSDQEPEYIGERARESYEQRSHTLHSKRNQKQKRSTRLSNEDFFSPQQKSPFEDDFSAHSFHATEFSSVESPSAEMVRKPDLTRRKDSQLSEPELKLPTPSPLEESHHIRGRESPSRSKASHGSSRRQSPFEDDFTPPETRRGSARVPSSISSDVSEHRRSPHDDATTPNRASQTPHPPTTRGGSLAADDVFLPASSIDIQDPDGETPEHKIFEPRRTERRGWSEDRAESSSSARQFSGMRTRLSVLRATDSNPNIKKSESVNIFARDNDPFDDDFFADSQGSAAHHGRPGMTHDKPKNNNDSFCKWSEPFDNFDFKEED